MGKPIRLIKRGIHHEAAPGILLMLAMVAALAIANSGVQWIRAMLDTIAVVGIGEWAIQQPLLLWINDGLMAVFFLLIGLELKHKVLIGELSDMKKVVLPISEVSQSHLGTTHSSTGAISSP